MATKEDEEALVDPFIISSPGLGFLFITQSRTLKPLSTTTKLADGAIKTPKAILVLHSPSSPQTLIIASKGPDQRIQGLNPLNSHQVSFEELSDVSNETESLRRRYQFDQVRSDSGVRVFFRGGYKLSKNFIRVVEGFVGLQLDCAVKQRIDALGLFVRHRPSREKSHGFVSEGMG